MAKPKKSTIRGYKRRAARAGIVSTTRNGWGTRWRASADLPVQLDAVALVDHVSDAVLGEHYDAIVSGRKADGSQPQPPLLRRGTQGRKAAAGERPDIRGYTGRTTTPFGANLTRTPVKVVKKAPVFRRTDQRLGMLIASEVEGVRAKTTIEPDPIHLGWLSTEAGRGVEYFYVGGVVEHLVDLAIAQWLDVGIDGALAAADKRERRAKKSKSL